MLRTLESRTEAGRGRVDGLKREQETREAEKSSIAAQAENGEGEQSSLFVILSVCVS